MTNKGFFFNYNIQYQILIRSTVLSRNSTVLNSNDCIDCTVSKAALFMMII